MIASETRRRGASSLSAMKRFLLALTCGSFMVGCSGSPLPSQPTSPPAQITTTATSTPPGPPNGANWIADATVISADAGSTCGWGTIPGETRQGVWWRITRNGASITLDEDMRNWPTDDVPFSGTLSGQQFTATEVESGGGVCRFLGGKLAGTFSSDDQSFDATETLMWGSPANPVRVQRHWTGHAL